MSTQVLPTLKGLGFSVKRSPIWHNKRTESASGKETAIAFWSYPRWSWELTYNVLESITSLHEFQDLVGFFNSRQGIYDSFLYADSDDYTVTDQAIGTGDGSTLAFQLVRSFGGFVEPVLAPHTITNIKVDGSVVSASDYDVSVWGAASPGVVTFHGGHAPANGKAITGTFTYYFPVRFDSDIIDFENFMYQLWNLKTLKFTSLK